MAFLFLLSIVALQLREPTPSASLVIASPSLASSAETSLQDDVFVILGVRKPGRYRLPPETSVKKAIETAGGSELMDAGVPVLITIARRVDNELVTTPVSLDELVKPNDGIVVKRQPQ